MLNTVQATPTPIQIKPRTAIYDRDIEYRYFEIFRKQTARRLTGSFDVVIWSTLLPQLCHTEPFVRHAVIALAAMDLNTMVASSQMREETKLEESKRHHSFALEQYGITLNLMRRLPVDFDDDYKFRNVLLCCFLTMVFESYQDNQKSSGIQTATALKLLYEFGTRRDGQRPASIREIRAAPGLDSSLIDHYSHLEDMLKMLQEISLAKSKAKKTTGQLNRELTTIQQPPKGESFFPENLSFDFQPLMTAISTRNWWRFHHDCISIIDEKERAKEKLIALEWVTTFEPVFTRCRTLPASSREYQDATMLMIHYLSTRFLVRGWARDTDTDALRDASKQILALAKDLLSHCFTLSSEDIPKLLNLKKGLISALFLVATGCQVSPIRREAISLMRQYPGEECMECRIGSRVAEVLADKEEELIPPREQGTPVSRLLLDYFHTLPGQKLVVCFSIMLPDIVDRKSAPSVVVGW